MLSQPQRGGQTQPGCTSPRKTSPQKSSPAGRNKPRSGDSVWPGTSNSSAAWRKSQQPSTAAPKGSRGADCPLVSHSRVQNPVAPQALKRRASMPPRPPTVWSRCRRYAAGSTRASESPVIPAHGPAIGQVVERLRVTRVHLRAEKGGQVALSKTSRFDRRLAVVAIAQLSKTGVSMGIDSRGEGHEIQDFRRAIHPPLVLQLESLPLTRPNA